MDKEVKSKKSFRGKILLRGENVPGGMLSACYTSRHSQDIPASPKEYIKL
jgi:hypothetical protein